MTNRAKAKTKAASSGAESASGDDLGTSQRSKRGGRRDGAGRKRKSGGDRPSTYTEALGLEICERLINGERLNAICKDPHMPASRVTVFRWRRANPAFDEAYLSARWDQREAIEDEVLQIAETETDIARARVKLDARRIVLGRLASTYGAPQQASDAPPFDLAGAIAENRKKLDALIDEVGWERAERIRQDEIVERARNPRPGMPEAMVRGDQRVAMDILEKRKKALIASPGSGGVH